MNPSLAHGGSQRELHMSDLSSVEGFPTESPRENVDAGSEDGSTSTSSQVPQGASNGAERNAPTRAGNDYAKWRPFGTGFKLPGWGRRNTAQASLGSSPRESSRLSNSSLPDRTAGSGSLERSERPSVARSSTYQIAPSRSWEDEPEPEHVEDPLSEITNGFAELLIPGEISEVSQSVLRSKMAALETLHREILPHLNGPNPLQCERAKTLLESIIEEIAVYGEFLDIDDVEDGEELLADTNAETLNYVVVKASKFSHASTNATNSAEDSSSERSSEASAYSTPLAQSPRPPAHMRTMSISTLASMTSLSSSPAASLPLSFSNESQPGRSGNVISVPPGPNDVLRWTSLQRLSLQLYTGAMRQKVGKPTVMAISGGAGIVIGTSRSMVLVYDFAQTLKVIIGDPRESTDLGPVTAISIGIDHKQIVCGYAHGCIRVWNLLRQTVLRNIPPVAAEDEGASRPEGHVQGASIIHIAFVGTKGAFVSADNEGNAFHHGVPLMVVVGAYSMTRLLPSSRSPATPSVIYAMAALPRIVGHYKHPGDQSHLVAFSTSHQMVIKSMKPQPQTQFKMSWARGTSASKLVDDRACGIACLAWSPLLKRSTEGKYTRLCDPLLACSFEKQLRILRVTYGAPTVPNLKRQDASISTPIDYKMHGDWLGDDVIVALQWVDDKLLLLLTENQSLILLDVTLMKEVDRTDVKPRMILSADYFTKGAPSTALAAYYPSIKSFKGRLFILGQREVTSASRLSWMDRLKALVVTGHFQGAIELGMTYFSGKAKNAVTGLPVDENGRQTVVGDYLAELLQTYIKMSMASYEPQPPEADEAEDLATYRQLAVAAFDTCLGIDRDALLFGDIYEEFCEKGLGHVYLEVLELYILDERVTAFSSPVTVQDFISHYENKGWLDRLAQVILHLDTATLDVHGIITVCLRHGLHSALIYVYTRVGDFVMPIIEILRLMVSTPESAAVANGDSAKKESTSTSRREAVYTLYVYLSYVLTGKAFPIGTLESAESLQARNDVFSFLLSPLFASWPPGSDSRQRLGTEPYPYLRLLFNHDPEEFLKVVAVVMSDSTLDSDVLAIKSNVFVADTDGLGRYTDRFVIGRQSILDALFVVIDGETWLIDDEPLEDRADHGNDAANDDQRTIFYCFVARTYARYHTSIAFPTHVLGRIILQLTLGPDHESLGRDERQRAVVAMLTTAKDLIDAESKAYLDHFKNAGFWRAYEVVIRRHRRFELLLECYINDPDRATEGFAALRQLIDSRDELSRKQVDAVKRSAMDRIGDLVQIDEISTADLVDAIWPADHKTVIASLSADTDALFKYLSGLLDAEWVQRERPSRSSGSYSQNPRTRVSAEIHERYIDILGSKHPNHVIEYLESLFAGQAGFPYDFDRVFNLCKKHDVIDAAAWLLEKSGNWDGALSVILKSIEEDVESILNGTSLESVDGDVSERAMADVITVKVDMGLNLCRRHYAKTESRDRETVWFRLLDSIVEMQHLTSSAKPPTDGVPLDVSNGEAGADASVAKPSDRDALHEILKARTRDILYAMVGHVSLPSILLRIVQSQRSATFGEHRDIIFSMLESYTYERELLQATNRVMAADVHANHVRNARLRSEAFRPARGQCPLCRRLLHVRAMSEAERSAKNKVVIMPCRHAFHAACLQAEMEKFARLEEWDGTGDVQNGTAWCVVCARTRGRVKALAKKKALAVATSLRKGKGKETDTTAETPTPEGDPNSSSAYVHESQAHLYHALSINRYSTNAIFNLLRTDAKRHQAHATSALANAGESSPLSDSFDEDGVIDYGDHSPYNSHHHQHPDDAKSVASTSPSRAYHSLVRHSHDNLGLGLSYNQALSHLASSGKYSLALAPPPVNDDDL
ncbi:Golgi CORVET complex core vacuolar protein 8-domain-containing protein [Fimicolochytrium jonesii]|uniref:Golgi CORVET complex core vacuolar protein 8-domain-containing protein n=1 Tax=Fimicolochytrium jonesii TaxID=1396493 RepID=UPI0022FE79E9|nr:Golgi CORVET complex core vacuolar protein 8-domain-containing protein [Fimicolochytrium jonesii]KAI8825032.1 Golgi CORVET complex core vacuolar protein 8-domain-containing protein [Fimicolochytrium jonesii]